MSGISSSYQPSEDAEIIEYSAELVKEEESFIESDAFECGRITLHFQKGAWTFNCLFCEFSFSEVSDFMQHITDNHCQIKKESDEDIETSFVYSDCGPYSEITSNSSQGLSDVGENGEGTSDFVEHTISLGTQVNGAPMKDLPYKCEYCEKSYRSPSKLRDHLKTHTGETPFKCDICSKGFRTNEYLRFHRNTHTSNRPFQCHHCSLAFTQKRYLQMHLNYHLNDRNFPCSVCGKGHRTRSQLKIHMTKHTANKDNICEKCGACYRLRQHLKLHQKQKHENKREFKCEICNKAFNTIGFLNNHKRSHSNVRDHICSVCGVGFTWRKNLLEHIKLHTGVKTHECDICGKAFAQKSGLITHSKTHG